MAGEPFRPEPEHEPKNCPFGMNRLKDHSPGEPFGPKPEHHEPPWSSAAERVRIKAIWARTLIDSETLRNNADSRYLQDSCRIDMVSLRITVENRTVVLFKFASFS